MSVVVYIYFYIKGCRRPHQRHVYDRKIIDILNNWYLKHKTNPYASKEEKMELVNQTSLSEKQITTWLINARFKNLSNIDKTGENDKN